MLMDPTMEPHWFLNVLMNMLMLQHLDVLMNIFLFQHPDVLSNMHMLQDSYYQNKLQPQLLRPPVAGEEPSNER